MRVLPLAPLLLLLAPAPGIGIADTAIAAQHLCGDDTIAPGNARLMPGYGAGGFAVRTGKPQAQAFFSNAMQLSHAFAHKAGITAFAEARRLDPLCAMCAWGEAWASGPTINYPVDAATQVRLGKVVDAAERLAATGPDKERQMIAALALRYRNGGGKGAGDLAFAKAMDDLARTYPTDNEIAVIAADAWMIPASLGGKAAGLPRAIALLEGALQRDPTFTPAIHFYIHATEMSGFPARAERYADMLAALAPAASHLVHMPSHTYYWIGRYQDAADSNVRAAAIDETNARARGLPLPGGVWQLTYHAHNVQFGIGGALIAGDARSALDLAAPIIAAVSRMPKGAAFQDMTAGTGYFAEGRFAAPAAVLALPEPSADHPFLRAYRHYARGEALARQGDASGVRTEAAAIPDHVAGADATTDDSALAATDLMRIARLVLLGRAAMLDHAPDKAAKFYMAAAKIEEAKPFAAWSDPPIWWYPVRRSLAAALLASGKPQAALIEADAALKRRPRDPVTLGIKDQIAAALAGKPVPPGSVTARDGLAPIPALI